MHTSMTHRAPRAPRLLPSLLAAALAVAFGPLTSLAAHADTLPTAGKVVAGKATISSSAPNTLQVIQWSNSAAIDWASFNIGASSSVLFRQPSARSIVLNRVTGADASKILGRLQANGEVFLVNPYGIVFGRDAHVDVAGLVASTANISNADFMAGKLRFTAPGKPGAQVINQGEITVREGGLAALVAPGVSNRGTIDARLGTVALASGDAFTLDPYGDRLIQWVVPAPQLSRVVNEGTLSADGGSVQITARAVSAVIDGAVNLGGTIRARTVAEHAGRIVLEGDAATVLTLAGTLDASGLAAGQHAGSVELASGSIQLDSTSVIDARGDIAGGTVHLGGGWHGAGSMTTVASTAVDRGALIDVSAVTSGAGGEAVVWSNGQTRFDGRIVARGGAAGGDGGSVEVSGHRLAYDGSVDAAAAHGKAGTLLLDPDSLLLQSTNTAVPTGAAADVVTTESIDSQLAAGTNVQLSAAQDITVVDRIDARLVSATGNRLNQTGANLSLTAGGNLALSSDVILDGGMFTGIAGGRIVQAATNALLSTGGGDALLQAGQGIALHAVQNVRDLTLITQSGNIELAAPIGLSGHFVADVMQAQVGDRVHLNGLVATSADAQPAVRIDRSSGNSGAANVLIDDQLIAAGDVSIQGASVTLAAAKAIDTRAISGGRAGGNVSIDAGAGGLALAGNIYVDDAAVTLTSQGDLTQANASSIASGSGAVSLTSAGTTTVSLVQTTGALAANGARVVFDAGGTGTAVQAGSLQVNATGSAAQAVDVRSSIQLGDGDSTITSANDFMMQPSTLIATGASGTFTINAAHTITMENLTSTGAGVMLTSAHGDVLFNQALGGRAAGDTTSVTTLGGDTVPAPTLYALDVRAPEGRINVPGLLLYGLPNSPTTLDMPAPGPLAYGLNLSANEVDIRGLVFVLDGAVSIQGATKLVIGNSIRSANGYAMSIGGGEIDLYRPTHPDGSPYQNTDIVVAQYADGSLHFFEQLNGVWQESTSFLSVVMPADLPLKSSGLMLPSYWIDRTVAAPGIVQVSVTDPSFAESGVMPERLVSLLNSTPNQTGSFNGGLDSLDAHGLNPYVPLTYVTYQGITSSPDAPAGAEVQTTGTTRGVPGTRFVPKILITNDPGPSFTPGMVSVGGVLTTNIGRVALNGNVYDTDSTGKHLIADLSNSASMDSAGDLRDVALKIVSFDTRSIFQDSQIATAEFNQTDLGTCTTTPRTCLDDPQYETVSGHTPFNNYPRIVYPGSTTQARETTGGPDNAVSAGFQATGYLSLNCVGSGCDRPAAISDPAYSYPYDPAKAGANPNALSTSFSWVGPQVGVGVQPGTQSLGRYEYFTGSSSAGSIGNPALRPNAAIGYVQGLSSNEHSGTAVTVKFNIAVTQTAPFATFDAPTPTRTVLVTSFGVLGGQNIAVGVDGTSAFKPTLPNATVGGSNSTSTPTFSTITPTLLNTAGAASGLTLASSLPSAPVSAASAIQPPVTAPPPPDTTGPAPGSPDDSSGIGSSTIGSTLNGVMPETGSPTSGTDNPSTDANGNANLNVAATGPLLVLGGRGLAQSVDLGRSGGLGALSSTTRIDYEVACTNEAEPRDPNDKRAALRRDRPLPACH